MKIIFFLLISAPCMAQFHLKVEPTNFNGEYYWVAFTSNNWKTTEYIMETSDVSDISDVGNDVLYMEKCWDAEDMGCEKAIAFARRFSSYKLCEDYNKGVMKRYLQLKRYRDAHPIKVKKEPPPKPKPTCGTTQLY